MKLLSTYFCVGSLTAVAFAHPSVAGDKKASKLDINPKTISSKAQNLDSQLISLSIEFGNIVDFFGDVGSPNTYSRQLLHNIIAKGSKAPILRLGGNTQDRSYFCEGCNLTMDNVYNGTGPKATEATLVTYNENVFRVMEENLDPTQDFIFGLNFGTRNKSAPQAALAGSVKYLDQSRVYAYELGNEINYYAGGYRPKNWTLTDYAQEQREWLSTLSETDPSAVYQFGAIVGPPALNPNYTFEELAKMGVPQDIQGVKMLSSHAYPKAACSPAEIAAATMEYFLNHSSTAAYVAQWTGEIAVAKANDYLFHIGEMSGIACHGLKGLSDTHGALLWSLDFSLAGASIGMDRVFFHNGKGLFYYNMWEPTDTIAPNGTVIIRHQVRPLYYSTLVIADLVKGVKKPTIARLSDFDTVDMAHYAVFEGKKLKKVVIINTTVYKDATQPRPEKAVDVSKILKNKLRVTRLTAPSVTSTSETTWAGQGVDDNGRLTGKETFEKVNNGVVHVLAGEAVIVEPR